MAHLAKSAASPQAATRHSQGRRKQPRADWGDTRTGKSTLFRRFFRWIVGRGDRAVVYDPAGEFTAEFYDPDRGDVILNPLDQRMPYWRPSAELAMNLEAIGLAASLFPDPINPDPAKQFFVDASRQIFAHLLEYDPEPHELASWLANEREIDARVAGTPLEQFIRHGAQGQRSGVLGSLATAGNALNLLPPREETTSVWSAREWVSQDKGWIFIRHTETTRDTMRPLISMWLDTLISRVMAAPLGSNPKPVWFFIDELATLQRLPNLHHGMTNAAKHNVRMVLGLQGMGQLQALYGDKMAQVILSQPLTKMFLRTGEPDAADWINRLGR